MKKRQKPRKSNRSPRRAPRPPATPERVKATEEVEAGALEVLGEAECEPEELPEIDEETKVVLLPVNPYLLHVYWGMAAQDLEAMERVFKRLGPKAQPVLRFNEITSVNFDGTNAAGRFEVEIDLRAKNWYVHLKSPAKSYRVDLGVRTAGGGFRRLARSNATEIPRPWPSDDVEESYLLLEGDYPWAGTVVPPGADGEPAKTSADPPASTEPYEGKDKRAETHESGFFRTVAPGEMERKLGELYRRERWEWPGLAPAAGDWVDPQPPGKEPSDLTELSEMSFRAGLSSGQESSVVSRQSSVKSVSED